MCTSAHSHGCAGRLSGTVSPFRAIEGTSLETPSRARAALFAFAYLQLWRLLLYRERRLSYQSLCLFLCLLWAALRTTLFSAAFSLSGSLPLLRPPAHLHFFPHWLLYCFPSCLQFSTLCLLNLYLAEVRREDRHAGPGGRVGPPRFTRAEDRWRVGGALPLATRMET